MTSPYTGSSTGGHNHIISGLSLERWKTGRSDIAIVVDDQTRKQYPKEQYPQPEFPEKEQKHTGLDSEMSSVSGKPSTRFGSPHSVVRELRLEERVGQPSVLGTEAQQAVAGAEGHLGEGI